MTTAPSEAPTLDLIKSRLGHDAVPEWIAHIISFLEGVVSANEWLQQYAGDWNEIAAIRDACDFASSYRWMSKEDFVKKLKNPGLEIEVSQQRMERFIVVEVLKELLPKLDRAMVIKITRTLAANLMSHAFQRVSADYTWDRVVFDTIPFMVDFAEKVLDDPVQGSFAPPFLPQAAISTENCFKLFAWHLYIEMESMTTRLSVARAIAAEIVTKSRGAPLHECCKGNGYVASDIAAVLVVEHRQNGHAARITDSDGNTILHYATQRRDDDVGRLVRVLYSAGANVNARNNLGQTPLAIGCASDASSKTIKELLQLDADPALVDNHGLAPVHYAVRAQSGSIVQLLAERHVNLNAVDKDGFTPAHVAASCGSVSMLELLAYFGASMELPSKTGVTPLSVASKRNHLQTVMFLFQTRNSFAAGHSSDPSFPKMFEVLREQLPELGACPQLSMSALDLDHLPTEIGFLRFARRLDLRHNSLKTFM